ncbi:hypothetical protein L7F22_012815 [Adiantum nelumboides]|nr:hypothetical protein [Adiantum nelumboides]
MSSISPHEQDEWDRFLLATHIADAWHIPLFGRSQGSLSFSWGFRGQVRLLERLDRFCVGAWAASRGGSTTIWAGTVLLDHLPISITISFGAPDTPRRDTRIPDMILSDQDLLIQLQGIWSIDMVSSSTPAKFLAVCIADSKSLHHLALFLLYAAPTSESTFTCPDANTISLHYQDRSIFLALKDIQTLYRLIFVELANCINCLIKSECSGKVYGQTVSDHTCGSHCDHANKEFTVTILQCCIYILPLLEFNTGLSLVAAGTLNSLFKQLVCPASHFLLCFKEFDEVVDKYRTLLLNCSHNHDRLQAFCCGQGASMYTNTLLTTSVEASIIGIIKELSNLQNADIFCSHMSIKRDTSCPIHDKRAQPNRSQIALALLEVFLEELLLQPGLADILKASDAIQNQFSPKNYVVLVIEAAAMHFTSSVLGGAQTELLHKNSAHGYSSHHGIRLSLPAAVILLDLSMDNDMDAPDLFLVHIINMLRCSLASSSCSIKELPGEIVLGCVASALESATSLYLDCWKANAVPLQHSSLQCGELLKCLSEKFLAICDGDAKKATLLLDLLLDQDNNSKALQQENKSTHSARLCICHDVMPTKKHRFGCFVCSRHINDPFHNGQQRQEQLLPMDDNCFPPPTLFLETKTTFLVSVLQLISTALFCLIAEAAKTFQVSRTPNGTNQNPSNAEVYIRHVRRVFKFCSSVDRIKVLSNITLDKELQDVIEEVDELTGNAFTFFAEWLLLCIKRDAPNALQQAYWDVLKCLLTLNFVLQRGLSSSASAVEFLCKVS